MLLKILVFLRRKLRKKLHGLKELRDMLEKYLKENLEEIKQNLVLVFIEDGVEKLNITKQIEASRRCYL